MDYFTFQRKRYENNSDGRALLINKLIETPTNQKTVGRVIGNKTRRYSISSLLRNYSADVSVHYAH